MCGGTDQKSLKTFSDQDPGKQFLQSDYPQFRLFCLLSPPPTHLTTPARIRLSLSNCVKPPQDSSYLFWILQLVSMDFLTLSITGGPNSPQIFMCSSIQIQCWNNTWILLTLLNISWEHRQIICIPTNPLILPQWQPQTSQVTNFT